MKYYKPGHHYNVLKNYEFRRHQPYDYRKKGILNRLISPVIMNTKNTTTRMVIQFVETVAQFLVEYVGELRNFKNPYYHKF